MRRFLAGLALLALALMAGCSAPTASQPGAGGHPGTSAPAPTASSSGAPTSLPAAQTPGGTPAPAASSPAPSSHPTAATPKATPAPVQSGVCGSSGSTISVQGSLTLDGAQYVLEIQMADYHGPGAYSIPPERVSLQSPDPSPTQPLRPALSGTVTVSAGGEGGTVNATLGPAGQPPLPLNASWTCP